MRAPISDPVMAGLAARVDEMNALAETSPGFIWRLRSEYVSSQDLEVFRTYVAQFDASRLFYNMSVWESVEHLRYFVSLTAHAGMVRNRREWLDKLDRPSTALWWIPAQHKPTVEDGTKTFLVVQERSGRAHLRVFRHRG